MYIRNGQALEAEKPADGIDVVHGKLATGSFVEFRSVADKGVPSCGRIDFKAADVLSAHRVEEGRRTATVAEQVRETFNDSSNRLRPQALKASTAFWGGRAEAPPASINIAIHELSETWSAKLRQYVGSGGSSEGQIDQKSCNILIGQNVVSFPRLTPPAENFAGLARASDDFGRFSAWIETTLRPALGRTP